MDTSLELITIKTIQGRALTSPFAGRQVRTRGVVTGILRRGFYLQTPNTKWDSKHSDAIFVFSNNWLPSMDAYLEVSGEVVDYVRHDTAKPVTQLLFDQVRLLNSHDDSGNRRQVNTIKLVPALLPTNNSSLAARLNSLEGMLLEISPGQTFIAPSNLFGDYVLVLDSEQRGPELRSEHGGVLVSFDNPNQWFPGFRVYNYNHAQRLNVGAKLVSAVKGPLHYRADAWQLAVNTPFKAEPAYIERKSTSLTARAGSVTIMTLNCFNLDPHVESSKLVQNPKQDVDDDWGDGRFHTLAQAVVLQAQCPDIIALQEIQDDDGAELTEVVSADSTYGLLVKTIAQLSDVSYRWVNADPRLGEDGGQPGGNIRNGFLYNPERVELITESVRTLGGNHEAFNDSRKPLVAGFIERDSGKEVRCINVHLASKRHQRSIFAAEKPGFDAKLPIRVEQAKAVTDAARGMLDEGVEFYITGDFNDTEHSDTLATLEADFACNLVKLLPDHERYDYNHRGKLQVLMHGLVSKQLAAKRAEYEIIHGNELIGVQPGEQTDKPSDHAYVIARLNLAD